jgi:hypothetical protein
MRIVPSQAFAWLAALLLISINRQIKTDVGINDFCYIEISFSRELICKPGNLFSTIQHPIRFQ